MGTVVNMDKELSARLNKVRSAQRITGQQIIQRLFTEIVEMHGDRVNS
ncbi:carboxyltransferase, partial [Lactiplantibacillus plantarum]|nr:carboxyltransferase [Lactiplantibacillus plantarum]